MLRANKDRIPETSPIGDYNSMPLVSLKQMKVFGEIRWKDTLLSISALVDSGSAGNFIDVHTAKRLGVPLLPCKPPLRISSVDNQPIGTGRISY